MYDSSNPKRLCEFAKRLMHGGEASERGVNMRCAELLGWKGARGRTHGDGGTLQCIFRGKRYPDSTGASTPLVWPDAVGVSLDIAETIHRPLVLKRFIHPSAGVRHDDAVFIHPHEPRKPGR